MKPDLEVVKKKDPYNIQHLFKKPSFKDRVLFKVQNIFSFKQNTFNQDIKFWGFWAGIYSVTLFVLSLGFTPHFFWIVAQLLGSLCGFIVFSKVFQSYQYRKSLGYAKSYTNTDIVLGVIAAVFFLLPYVPHFG